MTRTTTDLIPLFVHFSFFFFFNDTATTEIYTLSLHDALPIFTFVLGAMLAAVGGVLIALAVGKLNPFIGFLADRKSTRLNSSHLGISYAVFCLRKEEHTCEVHAVRTYL